MSSTAHPSASVIALATALALVIALVPQWPSHAAPTDYVAMSDGVRIAVNVRMPDGYVEGESYPVVFEMSGYDGGSATDEGAPDGSAGSRGLTRPFNEDYVTIHASVRGTGCSEGEFDLFSSRTALDGYELIEWAAEQPWSTGEVAIYGHSYGGITGFMVAATQPPSLRAVTVSGLIDDLYRGIVYPGGVSNYGFPLLWTGAIRPVYDVGGGVAPGVAAGDEDCVGNQLGKSRTITNDPILQGLDDTDNDWWRARSLVTYAERLEVPVHITAAYQDEQTGARGPFHLFDLLPDEIPQRLLMSNGNHGTQTDGFSQADRKAWVDHWVRGVDGGFGTLTDGSASLEDGGGSDEEGGEEETTQPGERRTDQARGQGRGVTGDEPRPGADDAGTVEDDGDAEEGAGLLGTTGLDDPLGDDTEDAAAEQPDELDVDDAAEQEPQDEPAATEDGGTEDGGTEDGGTEDGGTEGGGTERASTTDDDETTDPHRSVITRFEVAGGSWSGLKESADFPLPDTQWTDLYLHEGGVLDLEPPTAETSSSSYLSGSPRQSWSYQAGHTFGVPLTTADADGFDELTFATGEMLEDAAIAGPITATLFVSSTAPDTELFVQLIDEAPDGTRMYLQRGMLKASHRAVYEPFSQFTDEGRIYRPWRPHTNPTFVDPGEVYEYLVEIWPVGHVLREGHRLLVKVHTPPAVDSYYAYVPNRPLGVNTVLHDAEHPSSLMIPFVPVDFELSEAPEPCTQTAVRCVPGG